MPDPAAVGPPVPSRLSARLLDDQGRRWQEGDAVRVETYLGRHPELRDDADGLLDLIFNEILLREDAGESPDPAEYVGRFPWLAEQLRPHFAVHQLLRPEAVTAAESSRDGARPAELGDEAPAAGGLPDIAGYEVLGEIGRGGMGVVYRARQRALDRLVALKVILEGAHADPEQLRRFRAEAEALARLRHPNFVQIHDYGVTGGRPFLALEYVDGGTLAQKAAGVPQPPRRAAQVVETLAAAVQHAHGANLVHRDLKPANVLLTAEGVLKITDFGLAKRLAVPPGAGAAAGQTQSGTLLGTPAYMAPEQVSRGWGDVGPATDTYALGAILYELLTGRPPFLGDGVLDVLERIKRDEPLPPTRLQPGIPRDLETICLKCLRKETARRYPGAHALADDLRRFLADEPISARSVGRRERLGHWCRRNPLVAALTALLAVVVLSALAGVTGLWLRAERLRHEAEAHLDEAQVNLHLAEEAVDRYCTQVSENPRLREYDLRDLRRRLLQNAVDFQLTFVERHGREPGRRAELARAYLRLGSLSAEIDARPRAVEFFTQAVALFEALAREHPEEAVYRHGLAQGHTGLGTLWTGMAERERAAAAFGTAAQVEEGLHRAHPEKPDYLEQLAEVQCRLGLLEHTYQRRNEAEAAFRQAVTLADELVRLRPQTTAYRMRLARNYARLGNLYRTMLTRRGEAGEAYRTARDLLRELVRREPSLPGARFELALTLWGLSQVYHLSGTQSREVEHALREGLAVLEPLTEEHANITDYQKLLALFDDSLGAEYEHTKQLGQAKAPWEKALKIRERLARRDPEDMLLAGQLGRSQMRMGVLAGVADGDPAGALAWYDKAVATEEGVLRRDPRQGSARNFLGEAALLRAETLTALGRHADALADWDRVVAHADRFTRGWFRVQRALTRARLGDHERATAEADEVLQSLSANGVRAGQFLAGAAGVYSLAAAAVLRDRDATAADRAALAERYAGRAMQLLTQAVAKGYCDLGQLRQSKDFEPLRAHADFRNFIRTLEAPDGSGPDQ